MGGKGSKQKGKKGDKPPLIDEKQSCLTEADYEFLTNQTGMSRADIKSLFEKFNHNNNGLTIKSSDYNYFS